MGTNSIKLHRVIRVEPELLYRAFLEGPALCKWMAPNGFTCTLHHLDPVVGGSFKMSFTNFATGSSHTFGGKYLELVPNQLLRYTDEFDDPNLAGTIEVTVTLKKVLCGTELEIEQAGIPDIIPPEMCYMGWQESLTLLTLLVETVVSE